MKALMMYLELEQGAAGWKAQTNPLSYGLPASGQSYKASTSVLQLKGHNKSTLLVITTLECYNISKLLVITTLQSLVTIKTCL